MKVVKFILLFIYGLSFELAFLVYTDYHASVDDLSTIVAKPVNNYNYHNANRHAHWQTGSVVDVYLDPNVNNDTKLGMQDAINKWNEAGVVNLEITPDPNNTDITVRNGLLSAPNSIVFGLTEEKASPTRMLQDRITINSNAIQKHHREDNLTVAQYTDMVCTHELGHALGLEHVTDGTNSVMQPGTDKNIQPYDIQRLRMLYNNN